ncbi:hypothetical protein [Nocardia brasiliensis]
MRRVPLKIIAAVALTLGAGAGVANAAPGLPLEPAQHSQVTPVGNEEIGVSPGSSSAASLACLVQALSSGAKYCL